MRPDAIQWKNTNHMLSIELAPRKTIKRRFIRCIQIAVIFHTVVALLIFAGIHLYGRSLVSNSNDKSHFMPAVNAIAALGLSENKQAVNHILSALADSSKIQFAVIRDHENNRYIHTHINSKEAWAAFSKLTVDETPAQTSPWWNQILPHSNIVHDVPLPLGTVKNDPTQPQYSLIISAVDQPAYQAMFIGSLGVIIALILTSVVVLPIVYIRIRRWTSGLSSLFIEMQQFSRSGKPNPLSIGGNDEVGFLHVAYNDLASRLLQSRQKLIEANEALERQVERRTSELHQAAAQLEQIATHDSLTGLANRRSLDNRLTGMFKTPLAKDEDVYCLVIDMDGFKGVNDSLGHQVGDELLCLLAGFLKRTCRQTDVAVRYGGDEFILLLRLKDPDHAINIAHRIQEQFREAVEEMFKEASLEKMPSLSIGMSARLKSSCETADEMIRFADKALYRAKDSGKDQMVFYSHDMAA